nr:50s ribosomal protein l27 [Quercus suber]
MALNTFRTGRAPSTATLVVLQNALSGLRVSSPSISQAIKRNASHQAQGRANGAKDGPGKRLGAKKTGGEYVIPGNILFKQRGTVWFPGDNCFMVRNSVPLIYSTRRLIEDKRDVTTPSMPALQATYVITATHSAIPSESTLALSSRRSKSCLKHQMSHDAVSWACLRIRCPPSKLPRTSSLSQRVPKYVGRADLQLPAISTGQMCLAFSNFTRRQMFH